MQSGANSPPPNFPDRREFTGKFEFFATFPAKQTRSGPIFSGLPYKFPTPANREFAPTIREIIAKITTNYQPIRNSPQTGRSPRSDNDSQPFEHAANISRASENGNRIYADEYSGGTASRFEVGPPRVVEVWRVPMGTPVSAYLRQPFAIWKQFGSAL